ncbi:MAG: SIS domain-containing protein [Kovacikia sp.]
MTFPFSQNLNSAGQQAFPHFMLQEIYQQPEALQTCLAAYLSPSSPLLRLPKFIDLHQIHILGSGTSRHAGLVAQYWLEQVVGIPTRVRSASEFLSAPLPLTTSTLTLAITQSGETADTLAAAKQQKADYSRLANPGQGYLLGITNHPDSSLAGIVDHLLPTLAGTEVGVAATKTFTTQLAVLACLSFHLASQLQTLPPEPLGQLLANLQGLPAQISAVLTQHEDAIQAITRTLTRTPNCIVLGQGINRAIALEGALKLKETTYIHAEGYAAGEFLHGPIALLDPGIPVIAIVPCDHTYSQVIAAVRKVKSHQVPVIGITTAPPETEEVQSSDHLLFDHLITLPLVDRLLSPFLTVVPLQLLAYHIAVQKGLNVDRPRNITKTLIE